MNWGDFWGSYKGKKALVAVAEIAYLDTELSDFLNKAIPVARFCNVCGNHSLLPRTAGIPLPFTQDIQKLQGIKSDDFVNQKKRTTE